MAFSATDRRRAEEVAARYPQARSAMLPLLFLVQDRDGSVTAQGIEDVAEFLGLTPAVVLGTCSFYTMFKTSPVGSLVVSVCTNVACMVKGGMQLHEDLRRHYAADDDVFVEEVECIAHCDRAPAVQINYDFHGPLDAAGVVGVVDEYRSGARPARTISGTTPGGGE